MCEQGDCDDAVRLFTKALERSQEGGQPGDTSRPLVQTRRLGPFAQQVWMKRSALPLVCGRSRSTSTCSRTSSTFFCTAARVAARVQPGIGFTTDGWHGLFAPKGTPPAVVALLNQEVTRIPRRTCGIAFCSSTSPMRRSNRRRSSRRRSRTTWRCGRRLRAVQASSSTSKPLPASRGWATRRSPGLAGACDARGAAAQVVALPARPSSHRRSETIAIAWPDCCSATASLIVCPRGVCALFGDTLEPITR